MDTVINEIISEYDLFEEDVCVDKQDIMKEIRENHVNINFSKDSAIKYSAVNVAEIINMIIKSKELFLKKLNHTMLFYMWYDAQAMQLLYCIISYVNNFKLPFGREVTMINNMFPIIERFLYGCVNDQIIFDDFEVIDDDTEDVEIVLDPLPVFIKILNLYQ